MSIMQRLPQLLSRLACAALCTFVLGTGAHAGENPTLSATAASGYESFRGQPFFLLTDASYGSDEVAKVRLEVSGGDAESLKPYGGADILLYRIAQPLDFLKGQKNLHRVQVTPNYRGEGLSNTLSYLWDSWYQQTRRSWQRILSPDTRKKALVQAPQLKAGEALVAPTRFEQNPQFEPLKGYDLAERFRYPLWDAKPIEPPKGVAMAGSSSDFLAPNNGNLMIPVGKLKPGLYLVEAVIGAYRANTLLFVTDTVAITKSTHDGMLAWTADRVKGTPVANAKLQWTDGLGVLKSGQSGSDGVLQLDHVSPERSYLIGEDAGGGVFISENFYYDSEIYNAKLYAVTDRPLYRPGDEVHVKFVGRDFRNATESAPVAAGAIELDVLDPNGSPVAHEKLTMAPDTGADTSFTLPANASAGGYSLRFTYGGSSYGGAFRVAEYIKPHFDVALVMDKPDYGTGEALQGHVRLSYPDGRPVKQAHVSISVRAQQVSMVEGELRYAGLFPVKLEQQERVADNDGNVPLQLPPAKDPSRYVITILASDGAAYRVRITRELLVARGITPYTLATSSQFTQPGEKVDFNLTAQALPAVLSSTGASTPLPQQIPTRWELTRLEDQSSENGQLSAQAGGSLSFPVTFKQPGSYTLSVKDQHGNLLAATSHWVAGNGITSTPGSVQIVLDKPRYAIGDTAEALITFPQPVANALLTLERDKVEQHALLAGGASWLDLSKISDTQWRARIRIAANFSPNMTFSVLYVKDGDYAFQNAGLAVAQPQIAIAVKSDKPVYTPGDTVQLDLDSSLAGKPQAANLTVSVVDEMVYVLQPEIAPNIVDFFYHPRRNSVRTTSSLNFISYDMALAALPGAPEQGRYNERGVKVLERPRRDEKDTAAWVANLKTDAAGHAHMSFVMPDSLTRWRVTVRAATADGVVGQTTANVRSDKPLYLKWTGPTHFRSGDKPRLDMVAFNQGSDDVEAQLQVDGAGLSVHQSVKLKRGPNVLTLPVDAPTSGVITAQLLENGKTVDSLQTTLAMEPVGWLSPHQLSMPIAFDTKSLPLPLPADAQNLSLRFVTGAQGQFARVADELVAYPYGCVEQTSSRLIPLALAVNSYVQQNALVSTRDTTQGIDALLRSERQRLAMLAGTGGVFGWWGDGTGGNPFLTAYAYYADWLASRSLGLQLPPDNWKQVLESYKNSADQPLLHRVLELYWANRMGLPVQTQLDGLNDELLREDAKPAALEVRDSLIFVAPDSTEGHQLAVVLAAQIHHELKQTLPAPLAMAVDAARQALAGNRSPFVQSLLVLEQGQPEPDRANLLLAGISSDMPTMERAIALTWLQQALGTAPGDASSAMLPGDTGKGQWQRTTTPTGRADWRWSGSTLPNELAVNPLLVKQDHGIAPVVVISYDSRAKENTQLPITLQRKLYKLVAQASPVAAGSADDANNADQGRTYAAEAVPAGAALDANTLYVDEVTLTPTEGTYRYGLLEVPLPPGGDVEASTWGLTITGLDGAGENGQQQRAPVRQVQHEMGDLSYRQPVALLDHPQVYRQLVRFSLPGHFVLPPARYFRMYQPEAKALQDDGKGNATMVVK
jgi:uncharacterized protein YfaS (alpha-2-macroglobulin family)